MATMSTTWIDNQLPSPVSARKSPNGRDDPGGGIAKPDNPPQEAFGNLSNQSNSASGGKPSVPRRIGDIFRNRLKLAGVAALRSFSTSFPQECNMRSDVESSVEVPSPRTPKHGSKVASKARDFTSLDAVVIDERPGGRTSTLIGAPAGGSSGSGGGGGGGLRARRSSTLSRQRTLQRTLSSVNPQFVDDDGAVQVDETGYSGKQQQQQQQHSRNEDSSPSKTKQDDAVTVGTRTMADFHRQTLAGRGVGRTDGKLDGLGRGTTDLAPMEEVVVGKPPSRERINSTSHYSTEKSGSSGYYSTNLYSTGGSSVDEHIYCEPIDRRTGPLDTVVGQRGVNGVGEKKSPSTGTLPGVMGTRSTIKRRNDVELQPDNSIRLEQYYFPASLASPVQPVQLNVLRAATMTSNQHIPQHQQQQQSTKVSSMAHLSDTTSAGDAGTGTEQQQLSVIMEGTDGQIPRPIWPLDTDDSLMDINLESFRMANHSSQNLIGFESPSARSSISDGEAFQRGDRQQQQQQPVAATTGAVDTEHTTRKKSQYEEYLEFHNTRNILEQIRGKLNTLLEQQQQQQQQQQQDADQTRRSPGGSVIAPSTNPFSSASELERNIAVLKADLDGYLRTMNQKNENEIGRFCKGMSREPKVLAVQNAVEQRNRSRSGSILSFEHEYELLERGHPAAFGQTVVFGGASNSTTGAGAGAGAGGSFLPYYQVLAPNLLDPDRRGIDVMPRDEGVQRPPAALPASVLALNRRSPPNPFAQEVRSSQMLQAGSSSGAAGLHSLCCQQRYLNNDEIRVCSRYGGCDRNVTIDMPTRRDAGDADEDDDEDDESYIRGLDYGAIMVGRSVSCQGDAVERGSGSDSGSVSIGIPDDPDRRARGLGGGSDGRKHNGDSASDSGERPMAHCDFNQLQRNMTLERIILMESLGKSRTGQFGDKEKMLLEWHQNKPSCWELYYGANREEHKPHQTLIRKMKLGRKSTVCISYPSTRPESDFTLDVPRAEQLRQKMKKEKQFRSRCRWFFYFLSVVFFLLSVMVVSLILTRGKRMFGSMI